MTAPRTTPASAAYPFYAVLAAANDDVLGTALAEVCARHRPRSPELLELTHLRRAESDAGGSHWFLFVAAVMGGELEGDLADTHPSLAREIWEVSLRWTHQVPMRFRKFPPGHPSLVHYHRTPPGVVLPASPPERPRPTYASPAKRPEPEAPTVKPIPAAVPEQKGLF